MEDRTVQGQITITGCYSPDPVTRRYQIKAVRAALDFCQPNDDHNQFYPMAYGPADHLRQVLITVFPNRAAAGVEEDPEYPYVRADFEVMETGASWLGAWVTPAADGTLQVGEL